MVRLVFYVIDFWLVCMKFIVWVLRWFFSVFVFFWLMKLVLLLVIGSS